MAKQQEDNLRGRFQQLKKDLQPATQPTKTAREIIAEAKQRDSK